jgi:hypothetical protein
MRTARGSLEGFPASGTSLRRAHLRSHEQHHFNTQFLRNHGTYCCEYASAVRYSLLNGRK